MNTRQLLSSTFLYGVADVIVLVVGGFLLLPLYTRMLSQSEFGIYVTIRANIEIITFVLFLGIPSAFTRVYFDYKNRNQHFEFVSSLLTFFLLVLVLLGTTLVFIGKYFWAYLSPNTPINPYLGFSLAIVAVGFFGTIASLWLRVEERVTAFVSLQVGAASVLAIVAVVSLVVLDLGLSGVLVALLISSTSSALALPWLFCGHFRLKIQWVHITALMHYALPIMIGYIAYFIINRFSILVLQRHVSLEQIAIFGLAQQLSTVVAIASAAFGKAFQPSVFAAVSPIEADEMIKRLGSLLMLMMFGFTSVVVLFASELYKLMAPNGYSDGYEVLLILMVGAFAYSFTLISNTALLYHKMPKTSVAVTIVGAVLSAMLSLWLIPKYQLYGAAISISASYFVTSLINYWLAYRVTGHSYLAQMVITLSVISLFAFFATWLQHDQYLSVIASASLKLFISALIIFTLYMLHIRKSLKRFLQN